MTRLLEWFYRAMVWLTEFELVIATATSSNFNYLCRLKDDVRRWHVEQRKFELRSGK